MTWFTRMARKGEPTDDDPTGKARDYTQRQPVSDMDSPIADPKKQAKNKPQKDPLADGVWDRGGLDYFD